MSVTIHDVAKHAGVSTATVSRYLNNSQLIAHKSAEKVRRSIAALQYQPSFVARSLASHSTFTAAFVIDSTHPELYGNDYFLRIQYGIEATLGKQGYYLLIISVTNTPAGEENLRKLALEKRVEGMILPQALATDSRIAMLQEIGLPFVVIGRRGPQAVHWVDLDNTMGGRIATESLLRSSSGPVAFVSDSLDKLFVRERYDGYLAALAAAGQSPGEHRLLLGCRSAQEGEAAARLLAASPETEAILCTDNLVAYGLLRGLKGLGVPVPEQVQLLTFDNTFLTELSIPPMSAVEIDVERLGRTAAEMLLSAIQGAAAGEVYPAGNTLLPVSLVLRGSTRQ
jgi:DNA-binding LacI/PurR family transcriptional regulator